MQVLRGGKSAEPAPQDYPLPAFAHRLPRSRPMSILLLVKTSPSWVHAIPLPPKTGSQPRLTDSGGRRFYKSDVTKTVTVDAGGTAVTLKSAPDQSRHKASSRFAGVTCSCRCGFAKTALRDPFGSAL